MRRTVPSGGFRVVFWVVLTLVIVAPCLHLAAGSDHFRVGGKHLSRPTMPWASATSGVTLEQRGARWTPPEGAGARPPVIVRSLFVPPEA